MKIDDLFFGTAFLTGLLGLGGIGGYIDQGTGLIPSLALLIVCGLSAVVGTYLKGGAKDAE